ncbi:hypothetical protein C2E23DRAFT_77672 [Lenzites betulinus]|nr:hypothetical protein C2E23DRAFT_77672 [Lenzites betulinus]
MGILPLRRILGLPMQRYLSFSHVSGCRPRTTRCHCPLRPPPTTSIHGLAGLRTRNLHCGGRCAHSMCGFWRRTLQPPLPPTVATKRCGCATNCSLIHSGTRPAGAASYRADGPAHILVMPGTLSQVKHAPCGAGVARDGRLSGHASLLAYAPGPVSYGKKRRRRAALGDGYSRPCARSAWERWVWRSARDCLCARACFPVADGSRLRVRIGARLEGLGLCGAGMCPDCAGRGCGMPSRPALTVLLLDGTMIAGVIRAKANPCHKGSELPRRRRAS